MLTRTDNDLMERIGQTAEPRNPGFSLTENHLDRAPPGLLRRPTAFPKDSRRKRRSYEDVIESAGEADDDLKPFGEHEN